MKKTATPLVANQQYTFSFYWSAGSNYAPNKCHFGIASGSSYKFLNLNAVISEPYAYQKVEYTFTSTTASSAFSIEITCNIMSLTVDFIFDDFSLVPVPISGDT